MADTPHSFEVSIDDGAKANYTVLLAPGGAWSPNEDTEDPDRIHQNGRRASGPVDNGGHDSFAWGGVIIDANFTGETDALHPVINDKEYPADKSLVERWQRDAGVLDTPDRVIHETHDLVVESNNAADYEFVTGGAKLTARSPEGPDKLTHARTGATGHVEGGKDLFTIHGPAEFRVFEIDGSAQVHLDGESKLAKDLDGTADTPDPRPPSKPRPEPPTKPSEDGPNYRKIAEDRGIDVERVEHVSRASEIGFESGTVYAVSGALEKDDLPDADHASNTAVVGGDDARLVVPCGDIGYDARVKHADNLLWWGVDLDQRARGAYARLYFGGEGQGVRLENTDTIGDAIEPGYDPDDETGHDQHGPTFYLPALDSDTTNVVHDVHVYHGGTMESEHWGIGPIGFWLAHDHLGTLRIRGCTLRDIPSDGIYCTNTRGHVEVENTTVENCSTAGIRIARGHILNCRVSYDYRDTTMTNAGNPGNACVGVMVEAKQGVSGVEMRDTTVKLKNVGRSRAAVVARNLTDPGQITLIEDCRVLVDDAPGRRMREMAPAVAADERTILRRIEASVLDGEARTGVHVWNQSQVAIKSADNAFGPARKNARGNVEWDA